VDGATTTHWLRKKLMPLGLTVSRVGQGVPMGGALDVLDDGTLAAALWARRLYEGVLTSGRKSHHAPALSLSKQFYCPAIPPKAILL
jgi:hypothetical protein